MSAIDHLVSPETQTEEVIQLTLMPQATSPERQFDRDQTIGEVIDKMRIDKCTEAMISITQREVA